MRTNKLTTITITMLATFILFGTACNKNNLTPIAPGSSTVSLYLTDDPSIVFDNLFLDIQKVEVKAEDSLQVINEKQNEAQHTIDDKNGLTGGGWIDLKITPGVTDLLKFRNGLDTVLGSVNFTNDRNLKKIRVTLGINNHGVLNGISVPLVIKGKDNVIVLNLDESSTTSTAGQFHLSINIDAGRSIHKNGNEFELSPQVKSFDRIKAGSIEGQILPADAHALVFAINGGDTSSAIPGREGEFKISGLKDGNYILLLHPTANAYLDSTLQVNVAGQEGTHILPVTLHK